MRASAYWALQVVGALTLAGLPAFAQEPAQTNNDALVAETPLTPEESAMLGNALVFDPAALAMPSNKPLRVPGSSGTGYGVTRTQNMDGSSSVVVNQPLQTDWNNSVGADLGGRGLCVAGAAPGLSRRGRRRGRHAVSRVRCRPQLPANILAISHQRAGFPAPDRQF